MEGFVELITAIIKLIRDQTQPFLDINHPLSIFTAIGIAGVIYQLVKRTVKS